MQALPRSRLGGCCCSDSDSQGHELCAAHNYPRCPRFARHPRNLTLTFHPPPSPSPLTAHRSPLTFHPHPNPDPNPNPNQASIRSSTTRCKACVPTARARLAPRQARARTAARRARVCPAPHRASSRTSLRRHPPSPPSLPSSPSTPSGEYVAPWLGAAWGRRTPLAACLCLGVCPCLVACPRRAV